MFSKFVCLFNFVPLICFNFTVALYMIQLIYFSEWLLKFSSAIWYDVSYVNFAFYFRGQYFTFMGHGDFILYKNTKRFFEVIRDLLVYHACYCYYFVFLAFLMRKPRLPCCTVLVLYCTRYFIYSSGCVSISTHQVLVAAV